MKSLKAQNKEVAPWLPERNSGISQAVTDYLKFLLGRTTKREPYPPTPTSTELVQLPQISTDTILTDLSVFSLDPVPAHPPTDDSTCLPRQKPCWRDFKILFVLDIDRYSVPRATLAWGSPVDCAWNQIVLIICLKHWRWAKDHNAFSSYNIDPEASSNAVVLGIMERWLRGKSNPNLNINDAKKNNKRRNAVSQSQKHLMYNGLSCIWI